VRILKEVGTLKAALISVGKLGPGQASAVISVAMKSPKPPDENEKAMVMTESGYCMLCQGEVAV